MTLNVKQMVTVGLGLGISTALGYHFLSSPPEIEKAQVISQAKPLGDFELADAPATIQPAVDDASRFAARQLPSFVPPGTSYEELAVTSRDHEANPRYELNSQTTFDADVESFTLELNPPEIASEGIATTQKTNESSDTEFQFSEDELFSVEPELAVNLQIPLDEPTTKSAVEPDAKANESSTEPAPSAEVATTKIQSGTKNKAWQTNPFLNQQASPASTQKPNKHLVQNQFVKPKTTNSNSMSLHHGDQETAFGPQLAVESDQPAKHNLTQDTLKHVISLNDPSRALLPEPPSDAHSILKRSLTNDGLSNSDVADISDSIQPQQLAISEAAAQRAVQRIEYGKTLSRRGAAFSARQEFLAAMQIIANANDAATGSSRHSQALKNALLAIKEAADFSVANPEQQIQMDVASVAETHRSNILTNEQAQNLAPVQAMNRYFAAAQQNLDVAGGRNVVSAEVFFCLGKLNTLLTRNEKVLGPYDTARSVVFHQAALLSDQQHHRSSNELGVLFAKNGRLDQAKLLFERSLISRPTARTWQNLAEAHRRLGEIDFANRATNEFNLLASRQSPSINSDIKWMPIEQFNAEAPIVLNQPRMASKPSETNSVRQSTSASDNKSPQKKSFTDRFKDLF
jgi:tetratricopeptide (TPR) repeat protein